MNMTTIRPWLYVTAAFLLLAAAWTSLIFVAVKHTPEAVPLELSTSNSQPSK
ncbi:MAG: hypothetical protein ABJQ29_11025 [Luteolibacter sp.]